MRTQELMLKVVLVLKVEMKVVVKVEVKVLHFTREGAIMAPPVNFESSKLKQEHLFWFNLHTNLVTWVPTMAKTPKNVLNVNSV